MSASQLSLIHHAVSSLRRIRDRSSDNSDSEASISAPTNRGNKLKRKASYIEEGQLDDARGPRTYRRLLSHAGYSRDVICQYTPASTSESDVNSSDDSDATEADEVHRNPFAAVRLDDIFAPLDKVENLYQHPGLSRPYYDKQLPYLTKEAGQCMRKEKGMLAGMNQIFSNVIGDQRWASCELMEPAIRSIADECFPRDLPELDEDQSTVSSAVYQSSRSASRIRSPNPDLGIPAMKMETTEASGLDGGQAKGYIFRHRLSEESVERGRTRNRPGEPEQISDPPTPEEITALNAFITDERDLTSKNTDLLQPDVPIVSNEIPGQPETMNDTSTYEDLPIAAPDNAVFGSISGTAANTGPQHLQSHTESSRPVKGVPDTVDNGSRNVGIVQSYEQVKLNVTSASPVPVRRMTTRAQAAASNCSSSSRLNQPVRRPSRDSSIASIGSSGSSPVLSYFLPSHTITQREPIIPQPSQTVDLPLSVYSISGSRGNKLTSDSVTGSQVSALQPVGDLRPELTPLLLMYIQKQSAIVSLTSEMYTTLLKVTEMRENVLRWTKAEGHLDEMSDGEDWIDHEDLGVKPPAARSGVSEDLSASELSLSRHGLRNRRNRAGALWGNDDYLLVKGMDEEELERLENEKEKNRKAQGRNDNDKDREKNEKGEKEEGTEREEFVMGGRRRRRRHHQ